MDFTHGGHSESQDQHTSAAEIARNRVLAAYSSTVESLKNLPASARDALMGTKSETQESQPQSSDAGQPQPNWMQNTYDQSAAYQRTPIYTQPYDPSANQTTDYNQPAYNQYGQYGQAYNQTYGQTYGQSYDPYNSSAQSTQPVQSSDPYNQYSQYPQSVYDQVHESPTATQSADDTGMLKDAPVNQTVVSEEWQKYHSAWQDYYKNYYSDYYAKAAESYLATEKLKSERIATGVEKRARTRHHFAPLFVLAAVVLTALFLQYNRLIFAPIMAYVSPDSNSVSTSLEAVDPTITQSVSPEPRLIIPKLNVDVPVAFGIPLDDINAAMQHGVAQFVIPGASALPGQIGNLAISGHSANDIWSSNPYKFIFSGLERLENGDLIYINYNSVRYTYKMTGRETVEPTDVAALVRETDKPLLTLITCTPLGTSRYRLLVSAEQISPTYTGAEVANPSPDQPANTTPSNNASMPANEPSFFENVWRGLFGN